MPTPSPAPDPSPRAERHAARGRMATTQERYTTALRRVRQDRPQRCTDGCRSIDLTRGTASERDGDAILCAGCGLFVCVACQTAPVDRSLAFCDPCCDEATRQDPGDEDLAPAGAGPRREVPMLHEVWDAALAQGRCPVCAAGLPHIGNDCPEDPSRRIDTPPPVLPAASGLTLPRPQGRPWAPWEGIGGQQLP